MNMGIISVFKSRYRRLMLRKIMNDLDEREARRYSSNVRRGMRCLRDVFDPHMLDVCQLGATSWNEITTATISRCWVRAHIFPVVYAADITEVEGKMSLAQSENNSLKDMIAALQTFSRYNNASDIPLSMRI